jgi:RNA polymerase sigma-70 factor, ECF subfamily
MSTSKSETSRMQRDLARDVDRHFEAVVVAYQQPLFAYAYRMSGCRQDAEEVVQDVFVRAYRALKTYEPDRIRAPSSLP